MHSLDLSNIVFPVYTLSTNSPNTDGTKSFYLTEKHEYDGDIKETVYVIDDKSIEGDRLAIRRLKLKNQGVRLFNIKYAVFFISDLIKLSNKNYWFIDSVGSIFQYKKTKRVRLVFKEISQVISIPTGGAIVEVKGISTRFKVLHAPNPTVKYAGILLVGVSYILYGLYDEKQEDSVRMI